MYNPLSPLHLPFSENRTPEEGTCNTSFHGLDALPINQTAVQSTVPNQVKTRDALDIRLYPVLAGYQAPFHYLVPDSQESAKWNQIILLYTTSQMPSVLWCCWLGSRKGIRPINWVVRYWRGYLSAVTCKWFAYGPADATVIPSFLVPIKSRMVYFSDASLPRLS